MARPVIAIATEDFAVYLDLSRHLRARHIPFETLPPGEPIPGHISVVVTTLAEVPTITHAHVVAYTTPAATVEQVVRHLKGLGRVGQLVVGVDPGERPGLAIFADGHVLASRQIADPDRVVVEVMAAAERYPSAAVLVRVGHGAPTLRDRIVNELLRAGFAVEMVDETSTSPPRARLAGERDRAAARAIAMTPGTEVLHRYKVRVPPGEIRDIQRRSRLASGGELTISRRLAGKVARGRMTLQEAVRRQRGRVAR